MKERACDAKGEERLSAMTNDVIDKVFKVLSHEVVKLQEPIVGRIARDMDPFKVLISTMLSLRTKDVTTEHAFRRLNALA